MPKATSQVNELLCTTSITGIPSSLFQLLASLFEALVFVYVGIAFPQLGGAAMRAHWPTALVLVIACLLGRAAGVWLSARFGDRSGRSSLLVWLLAGVVAAGALLTAALGGRAAVEELRRGAGRVKPFCAP